MHGRLCDRESRATVIRVSLWDPGVPGRERSASLHRAERRVDRDRVAASDLGDAGTGEKRRAQDAARIRSGRCDDRLVLGCRQRRKVAPDDSASFSGGSYDFKPVGWRNRRIGSNLGWIDRRKIGAHCGGQWWERRRSRFGVQLLPLSARRYARRRRTRSRPRYRWRRAAEAAASSSLRKHPRAFGERAGDGGSPSTIGTDGMFAAGNGWPRFRAPVQRPAQRLVGRRFAHARTCASRNPKGPHGNNKPSKPKNGKYTLMQFDGGWGSAWINPPELYAIARAGNVRARR